MTSDADRLAKLRRRPQRGWICEALGGESDIEFLLRMLDKERFRPRGKFGQPMLTQADMDEEREARRQRLKAKGR